ncbi:MAG: hypothetical protein CBC91_00170 [Rickettsiales bacterium TMED131]|nr:MAG: hypothetical protein CBC91_00170 [Rickettsiales bacterium TMED131]
MTKMRTFTFYDGDKVETKEAISFKKAVRSYQGSTESKSVKVEWEAKKGGMYEVTQDLPIGRKIRQAALSEKKRAALKAKMSR